MTQFKVLVYFQFAEKYIQSTTLEGTASLCRNNNLGEIAISTFAKVRGGISVD